MPATTASKHTNEEKNNREKEEEQTKQQKKSLPLKFSVVLYFLVRDGSEHQKKKTKKVFLGRSTFIPFSCQIISTN